MFAALRIRRWNAKRTIVTEMKLAEGVSIPAGGNPGITEGVKVMGKTREREQCPTRCHTARVAS
jgi:hypothetical protein